MLFPFPFLKHNLDLGLSKSQYWSVKHEGGLGEKDPFLMGHGFPFVPLDVQCEKPMLGTVILSKDHEGISQMTGGRMKNGGFGEPK